MTEQQPVAVLGGGSFGTAIANLLAENGQQVYQWMRDPAQADRLGRLAAGLVRPATPVAADVRAVNRQSAVRLRRELQQAMGRGTDAITRAHLAETLAMLDEALKASLVKAL